MKLNIKPPLSLTILPDGTWEIECEGVTTVEPPLSEKLAALKEKEMVGYLKMK
jgi:hypothetical protein